MSDPVGLQSVDFLPQAISNQGPANRPEYESFSVLVERANHFLRGNPQFTVNTCESVEFRVGNQGYNIDTVSPIYTAYGEAQTRYIRGLRLWTQTKSGASHGHAQIGYFNFLPRFEGQSCIEPNLDVIVGRINHQFLNSPVTGHIITVETQPVKWGSRGLDPDRTIWTERGNASTYFVNVIRIFYIHGPAHHGQIGLQDFLPAVQHSGGWSSSPVVETFPTVMNRAREWLLSLPPNCRPVNVQTVMFRWSFNEVLNTRNMVYHEDKKDLQYLRYLRVAYIMQNPNAAPPARSLIQFSAKLITPIMARPPGWCNQAEVETQESTRARIDAWVKATGARVVSAESLVMRIEGGGETRYGFEAMHTWNRVIRNRNSRSRGNESFMHLYRIYTDGVYQDPAGWQPGMQLQDYARGMRRSNMWKLVAVVGAFLVFLFIIIMAVSMRKK